MSFPPCSPLDSYTNRTAKCSWIWGDIPPRVAISITASFIDDNGDNNTADGTGAAYNISISNDGKVCACCAIPKCFLGVDILPSSILTQVHRVFGQTHFTLVAVFTLYILFKVTVAVQELLATLVAPDSSTSSTAIAEPSVMCHPPLAELPPLAVGATVECTAEYIFAQNDLNSEEVRTRRVTPRICA